MDTRQKSAFTLSEFHKWRKRRTIEPIDAAELDRRRELGARSDQILSSQKPLPVPVEELVKRSQRYND